MVFLGEREEDIMKKKIITALMISAIALTFSACGGNSHNAGASDKAASEEVKEPEEPTDLTGTWQSEENDGSYQEAVISEDRIEINWVSDGGDTKSIYWIGTYEAPTEAVDEYEHGSRLMDSDLIEGLVLLAQYHDEAGNEEEALRFMKLGADHGQATLAYTYGRHLQDTDRAEEAEKYFKQSLEGQFTKVRARQALAMLYLQTPGFFQNHKTEAWEYIKEGVELLETQRSIAPECYILFLLKGDYLRRIGNYKSARDAYKSALDKLQKAVNDSRHDAFPDTVHIGKHHQRQQRRQGYRTALGQL